MEKISTVTLGSKYHSLWPVLGLHKTVEVEPLKALLDAHSRTRATADPDAPHDRFESDAMLISGPRFNSGLRVSLLQSVQLLRKVFLRASCAAPSGSAWHGRSTRLLYPRRLRYSQPRCGWTLCPV
jgi:hypothetical protein